MLKLVHFLVYLNIFALCLRQFAINWDAYIAPHGEFFDLFYGNAMLFIMIFVGTYVFNALMRFHQKPEK